LLKWLAPQVLPAEFDQIEDIEKYMVVSLTMPKQVERWNPVVIARNRLAIDRQDGSPAIAFDDQREALGRIVAQAAIEPHP